MTDFDRFKLMRAKQAVSTSINSNQCNCLDDEYKT